jgi:hypothetical protein
MEFDLKLDAAIRGAFAQAGIRMGPGAKTSDIVDQFAQFGVTPEVDNGVLVLMQNGAPARTGTALTAFVGKFPDHFVVPGAQVRSVKDLQPANTPEGIKQRVELIREQGGEQFAKIVNGPALRSGVIANREMSRTDWQNLTRAEKTAAIAADPEIVEIVHSRR